MRVAGIKLNDVANCPGIGISIYVQYCPHHCKGCFNPETWSKDGGESWGNTELAQYISEHLNDNGVKRNVSMLGGEPLCSENCFDEMCVISYIKELSPETKIYLWTGYILEDLIERAENEPYLKTILQKIDFIIDGPYIEEQRDITLQMRGSRNQRIFQRNEDLTFSQIQCIIKEKREHDYETMSTALIIISVVTVAILIFSSVALSKILPRIKEAQQTEQSLKTEIAVLNKTKEERNEDIKYLKNSIKILEDEVNNTQEKITAANNQYHNKLEELDRHYRQMSNNKFDEFNRWVEQAKQNANYQYEKTQEEMFTRVENLKAEAAQIEIQTNEHLQQIEAAEQNAYTKYQCLTEAYRKAEWDANQKSEYCILLSEEDASDINVFLTEIINKVNNKTVVGKLVWTNYVQKPLAATLKKLEIEDTPGIYKLTNIKNNKCYIGKSTTLKTRIQNHFKGACGIDSISDQLIHHEMIKEGLNNWMIEKVIECSKDELNEKERYYIKQFDSQNYGYNIAAGG